MLQFQFKVNFGIIELLGVHYIHHLRRCSRRSSLNYWLLFLLYNPIFKLSLEFSNLVHGFLILGLESILISNFHFKILALLRHLILKLIYHRLKFFHLMLLLLKVTLKLLRLHIYWAVQRIQSVAWLRGRLLTQWHRWRLIQNRCGSVAWFAARFL